MEPTPSPELCPGCNHQPLSRHEPRVPEQNGHCVVCWGLVGGLLTFREISGDEWSRDD